jgi:LPS sulfotransferase NodH
MKKFFIVSSQRSGTTWFAEKLAGMFGRLDVSEETNVNWWEEISSESFIERKKLNSHYLPKPSFIKPKSYLSKLSTLEAFEVFGTNKIIQKTEKFYDDVYDLLNDNEFVNIMYDQCSITSILKYPVIHFIRKNSIAQATSNSVAQTTGVYHNNEYYKNKINSLPDSEKNINLNYNEVTWEAIRCNELKEVYYNTLKKYHKNCLTIFYEDCLDENYWKNTLNEKLENFMQDKIQNAEYETDNKKTRNLFKINNLSGENWESSGYNEAIKLCKSHNLPVNIDSLTKILEFKAIFCP